MTENAVAKEIVDVAYRMHSALGPGLLESVYEAVLASELQKRGLRLARQQPIPIVYEGTRFEMGFRADLVSRTKSSSKLSPSRRLRPCTRNSFSPTCYLRLADKRLGLLINFNVVMIRNGITRIVNGLEE